MQIASRQKEKDIPAASGTAVQKARRKFLKRFPKGFRDETYLAWERDYKWEAHQEWQAQLNQDEMRRLMDHSQWTEAAARAVKIESGRSLLFSFEKMALRDAVREPDGAKIFVRGLYRLLYEDAPLQTRFEDWTQAVSRLPRKQTRVLTWPLVTVFGFIAQPRTHIFLKPNTTKEAARKLGLPFAYISRPNWNTYAGYLRLAADVRRLIRDMRPRDMIDIQSFLWVQGSDEYA
jgi:hypothetical protein